jgi:hypothetical protein
MRELVYDLTKRWTGAQAERVDLLRQNAAALGRTRVDRLTRGRQAMAVVNGVDIPVPAGDVVMLAGVDGRGRHSR